MSEPSKLSFCREGESRNKNIACVDLKRCLFENLLYVFCAKLGNNYFTQGIFPKCFAFSDSEGCTLVKKDIVSEPLWFWIVVTFNKYLFPPKKFVKLWYWSYFSLEFCSQIIILSCQMVQYLFVWSGYKLQRKVTFCDLLFAKCAKENILWKFKFVSRRNTNGGPVWCRGLQFQYPRSFFTINYFYKQKRGKLELQSNVVKRLVSRFQGQNKLIIADSRSHSTKLQEWGVEHKIGFCMSITRIH